LQKQSNKTKTKQTISFFFFTWLIFPSPTPKIRSHVPVFIQNYILFLSASFFDLTSFCLHSGGGFGQCGVKLQNLAQHENKGNSDAAFTERETNKKTLQKNISTKTNKRQDELCSHVPSGYDIKTNKQINKLCINNNFINPNKHNINQNNQTTRLNVFSRSVGGVRVGDADLADGELPVVHSRERAQKARKADGGKGAALAGLRVKHLHGSVVAERTVHVPVRTLIVVFVLLCFFCDTNPVPEAAWL
jgi:hypothetical protein